MSCIAGGELDARNYSSLDFDGGAQWRERPEDEGNFLAQEHRCLGPLYPAAELLSQHASLGM
jgi:hypothetical protein